jgi:transposase
MSIMAALRKVVEITIGDADAARLQSIARSRTEPANRVERARILLRYREDPSLYAVGRAVGVTHQTVQRCLARATRFGVMAALDDSPRPGKEPEITLEARAWLVSLACQKAKDVGYPHELWTTRLLARHTREHGPVAGHVCLMRIAQGTVCKILADQEVKPHKVRYYLERRDPEFDVKMAEVLCVYQEVAILRAAETEATKVCPTAVSRATDKTVPDIAFVSYDEKPGIQAISNRGPDLPPIAGEHACVARDHEYKRHGTLSLLAGIDLLTGQVHACVEDRHRSREFIGFLKKLDAAYRSDTAIKVILDNHSAHVSKETNKWLAAQPDGRFTFVFTPKHGSWLNLVEGFFSKMARSVLRRIRVASKAELKQRIMAYLDDLNREPVVHTWSYKITVPA